MPLRFVLEKGPVLFPERSGEGAALPVADWQTVKGREAGVVRTAGAAEDTARLDDDALARRLPIDRLTVGCWRTKETGGSLGRG